jgi:serine/threonine protein kinase
MRAAHSREIHHGSLKPSNVLLDGERFPRVSDFGALEGQKAEVTREIPNAANLYIDQAVGSEEDDPGKFTQDVYAFGVILYEMMMIGRGMHDVNNRLAFSKILGGGRPDIPEDFPDWVRRLIDDCWAANPPQRPTFAQIFQLFADHKFALTQAVKPENIQNFVTRMSLASDVPETGANPP